MASKIMKTIDNLLPKNEKKGIKNLNSYKIMQKDIEYLETFVNYDGVPNIIELISELISAEASTIPSGKFRPTIDEGSSPYRYKLSDSINSLNYFSIESGLFGIEIKRKVNDQHNKPTIFVNRFGHNRSGGLKNAKKGVHIQAYNIPKEIADIILKDFTKLEGERNDIILGLAHSEDITGCYSKDTWVNHQKAYINKGESPQQGIDENNSYIIEKDNEKVLIFGNAHGFKNDTSDMSIDIRVEVPGERFQLPSEREPGFDITEGPNQGTKRDGCLHYYGNKLPKLTKQKDQFIPVDLVGKSSEYTILQSPKNKSHPNGNEVIYSDEYIKKLNEFYPIDKVLGRTIQDIAEGIGLDKLVMGSPLGNSEGENILEYMLMQSAQAKQWQPFVIDVPELLETYIETAGHYIDAIADGQTNTSLAVKHRFALPIAMDNKVMVVPSQEFVEYIMMK
ncbi:MAG: hypothetical protein ACP5N1_03515 [Candidatus Woesearchaeota archaeon]